MFQSLLQIFYKTVFVIDLNWFSSSFTPGVCVTESLLNMVAYACNLSTWEAEAGRMPWVQDLPGPHSGLQASLNWSLSQKQNEQKRESEKKENVVENL